MSKTATSLLLFAFTYIAALAKDEPQNLPSTVNRALSDGATLLTNQQYEITFVVYTYQNLFTLEALLGNASSKELDREILTNAQVVTLKVNGERYAIRNLELDLFNKLRGKTLDILSYYQCIFDGVRCRTKHLVSKDVNSPKSIVTSNAEVDLDLVDNECISDPVIKLGDLVHPLSFLKTALLANREKSELYGSQDLSMANVSPKGEDIELQIKQKLYNYTILLSKNFDFMPEKFTANSNTNTLRATIDIDYTQLSDSAWFPVSALYQMDSVEGGVRRMVVRKECEVLSAKNSVDSNFQLGDEVKWNSLTEILSALEARVN